MRIHKKKKAWLIGISSAVLILGVGVLVYFALKQPEPTHKTPPKKTPHAAAVHYYSPLTGSEVADEAATKLPTTAIMIENSPAARPQSGLKESGVVFEAIAEGGITRFLALYQQEKPQLIGPVRSVRMYYVDWLAPFNASVAHVGGSAAALDEVRNGSYRDIDQFFNSATYWRATDRYAPHNVYTNFERLDALNKAKGYEISEVKGFLRKDSKKTKEPTATAVDLRISSALYNVHYAYNAQTNTYDRSEGGAPHKDREGGLISPRVVVGLRVKEESVFEDGWRESINAVGSGTGVIFQDGTVQEVTWTK